MKKISSIILILIMLFYCTNVSALTLSFEGQTVEYKGREVRLVVNGQEVQGDMPAIILNSRTLVPARLVFEKLGAEVVWNEEERRVSVSSDTTTVVMNVSSDKAYVNGVEVTLDSPARLINNRLMIPVRFPAEALGAEVLWEDKASTVRINLKEEEPEEGASELITIDAKANADVTVLSALFNGMISEVSDFTLTSGGKRIVVDVYGAVCTAKRLDFEDSSLISVRTGQYKKDPYIARIVLDVTEFTNYTIEREENKLVISIDTLKTDEEKEEVVWDNDETLSPDATKLSVMIDPGHGGEDVGAIGYEDGVPVLYEKDVDLAVSDYLREYLESAGVKTYMMRETDKTVKLTDRPEIANDLDVSLYISVHSNSFKQDSAKGTTVLYFKKDDGSYGIKGAEIAQLIQDELVSSLGTYDRGITDGSEMYVIRNSLMPAVIVEMAFISNAEDRAKLSDEKYQKLAAEAMCKAIIKALNKMAG